MLGALEITAVFGITCIMTLTLIPWASRVGLVDVPAGHKAHSGPTPLVGGLAIYLALLLSFVWFPFLSRQMLPFISGATLLLVVGILDDLHQLKPSTRFLAQIIAALIMTLWGGVVLDDLGELLGDEHLILGPLAVPFTLFAVVGVINAMNMIDGLDGLAGGLALVPLTVLGLGATDPAAGALLTLLGVAVLAFLLFNLRLPGRPQARVFLGNGGSMLLGYALAWFLVDFSQEPHQSIAPVTALWLLAVPLVDTICAILRRALSRVSPFAADRRHLHHILLARGCTATGTLAILLGLAVVLAAKGRLAEALGAPQSLIFGAFLGLLGVCFWNIQRFWQSRGPSPSAQGHVRDGALKRRELESVQSE